MMPAVMTARKVPAAVTAAEMTCRKVTTAMATKVAAAVATTVTAALAAFSPSAAFAADARGEARMEDTGATDTTSTAVGIGALASARGHEKLSARPA
jgi:hypothetical protein